MPATSISNSEADCIGVMPLLTKSAGVLPVTTIFSSLATSGRACPSLSFTVFMQQIPERDSRTVSSHIVSVLQSAVDGTLYLVPRAGGTIVVEKIVAVYSVFRAVVFC